MQEDNKVYIDDRGVIRIVIQGEQTTAKAQQLVDELHEIAGKNPSKKLNGIIDMQKFLPPSKKAAEIYRNLFEHPQVGKVVYLSKVLPFAEIFLKMFIDALHRDTVRIMSSVEEAYQWFEEDGQKNNTEDV